MECSSPGSFVYGISQARILEWGAISSSSMGSSQPRDQAYVSCIDSWTLYQLSYISDSKTYHPREEKRNMDVITKCPRRISSLRKQSACNAEDMSSIPGSGRSPGEGHGYPLQYSGLENSLDCIVHGVAKSRTRLSNFYSQCARALC